MANFSISYLYQIKDRLTPTLRRISGVISDQNQKLTIGESIWGRMVNVQARLNRALKQNRGQVKSFTAELKNSFDQIVGIGASIASIALPVKSAMEFETSMAGVAKAANLTKGTAGFNQMRDAIMDMSKRIPRTQSEIAEMAEAGARLGVSQKDLPGFVNLTAKTAVAFDMMSGTAGDALASISAKMSIPINKVESMMDAVNQLENTTSAKGNEMIDIIGRIAGVAKSVNLSPEQTAGLAAFANQITVSPELAASGLNMMIARMQQIPSLHKKLLESPKEAISAMLTQLHKLDKIKRTAVITQIFGADAGRFVNTAVESMDVYGKTMGQVADKSKFAGSMSQEFETQLQTTAAQAAIAKNGLNAMLIEIGQKLLPIVYKGALLLQKLAFGFAAVTKHTGPLVPIIASIIGVIAGARAAMIAFNLVMTLLQLKATAVRLAVIAFNIAMFALKSALVVGKIAMAAFNLVMDMNPISLVVMAIAALVVGVIWAATHFDQFKKMVADTWQSIKDNPLSIVIKPIIDLVDAVIFCYQNFAKFKKIVLDTWAAVQSFFGFGGNDLKITVDKNVTAKLQGGDSNQNVNVSGGVNVDINAPKGVVKGYQGYGNVKANTVGYGGYMAGGANQ